MTTQQVINKNNLYSLYSLPSEISEQICHYLPQEGTQMFSIINHASYHNVRIELLRKEEYGKVQKIINAYLNILLNETVKNSLKDLLNQVRAHSYQLSHEITVQELCSFIESIKRQAAIVLAQSQDNSIFHSPKDDVTKAASIYKVIQEWLLDSTTHPVPPCKAILQFKEIPYHYL